MLQQQPRYFTRQFAMGQDGLATFLLSNTLLLATLGLSGLWPLRQIWRMARDTPSAIADDGWIVVLGARARRHQVSHDYTSRLERTVALYQANSQRRILLVGGQTSGSVSEAEQGRRFLLAQGIFANALSIEDQSLHTLDNLRCARQLLGKDQAQFVLVTSRYHLARSKILARGLGLHPVLCAAEERLHLNPVTLWRLVLEAIYLHWYEVGRIWSRWTHNRHSLARIT